MKSGVQRSAFFFGCLLAVGQLYIDISSCDSNQTTASTQTNLASQQQPTPPTTTTTTAAQTTATSAPALNATAPTNSIKLDTSADTNLTTESSKTREELKRQIEKHIDPNHGQSRVTMNKPTMAPQLVDFAADSNEAKVADATSQFGLNFIKSLNSSPSDNVIISPLSLQNLLNMILLGSDENSPTEKELVRVLGYSKVDLLSSAGERLNPHKGMKSLMDSIMSAIHLTTGEQDATSQSDRNNCTATQLLNTDSASLGQKEPSTIAAHLQTSTRDDKIPLSGQLNLTLANLVMTNKDLVELREDYEKELKAYYDVKIESFHKDGSSAEPNQTKPLFERINDWVKKITNSQIEKLVEQSDLNSQDLLMVLLNAANFKGRWLRTFNKHATYDSTFFNQGKEADSSTAKFMRQKDTFGYAEFGMDFTEEAIAKRKELDSETLLTEDHPTSEQPQGSNKDNNSTTTTSTSAPSLPTLELSKEELRRLELTGSLNCSALVLPFSINDGQEFSMVLLLPNKRDGLAELEASLNSTVLNEIYRTVSDQQVQVEIPKFTFEGSHDAKQVLTKMGLSSVFEKASLGRMFAKINSPNQDTQVDKVVHKAKISVDEIGAEAAAASMASIVLRNFIQPPVPKFVADHPFLFVIRHNRSNMPLFMGRVNSL